MHIINEDIDFIISFIRDIGARLKTALVLTQCRRMRHGRFTAEFSLLLKDVKRFDPAVVVKHMEMSHECHSFESLQTDQSNMFLISNNSPKGSSIGDGVVDNKYLGSYFF